VKVRAAVICVGTLAFAAGVAPAVGSSAATRADTLAFSMSCRGAHAPRVAPVLHGVRAQFAVPAGWRMIPAPANDTSSGGGCAQPDVLVDVPGDRWQCLQQTVYADAAKASPGTPGAFLDPNDAHPVVAHGRLPAVAGMQGLWEELDVGVTAAYPSYVVEAVYVPARGGTAYELGIDPSPSFTGACHGDGPRARGIARQLVQSFRVLDAHGS
jgi:hypothetical protein